MTYEDAKPFAEKLYELAMWYHAKPNEFRKRAYEVIDDIAQAEREACAKVCDEDKSKAGEWIAGSRPGAYFAKQIRARGNT